MNVQATISLLLLEKKQTFLCPQPRGFSLQHKQLMLTACSMAGYRDRYAVQTTFTWLET